jgi:hypothetical protein
MDSRGQFAIRAAKLLEQHIAKLRIRPSHPNRAF